MRVLIMTKIFPNRVEPLSAPFNRRQFAALGKLCDVEVLAAIPWFPGATAFRRWSHAGRLSKVPESEVIDGLSVRHPRYALLPKIGHAVSGPLYAASLSVSAIKLRHRVDIVLGAWAYPDGYAAVVLAELLGVPAVVKLHGSDMNVVADLPGPRRRLEWALPRAARVVAVSRPLAEKAQALGVPPERIDIVRNGIDRATFRPRDRAEARRALGLDRDVPLVLYVGHVTREKGAFDLVRAYAAGTPRVRESRAVFVGDGAGLEECRAIASELGVHATFVGARPHEEIATWLAACDLLALPSWNEGMPNVVLEALASGRPVVATRVGGIPDVVASETLGALVPPRQPEALAAALERVLSSAHDSERISAELDVLDWEGSARAIHSSLLRALESRAREAA
ncbi:MAG TPA: glycosyltransferase family 4 protein [Polyangiaceae bacterium]